MKPFKTLEEFEKWQPSLRQPTIYPRNHRHCSQTRSEVIVCHDMAGGYLLDASLDGCIGYESNVDYFFRHWHLCDYFIYFSHHRISVPPTAWVKAAHLNGSAILGTIIMEWEEGIEEAVQLFTGPKQNNENDIRWNPYYADKLVALTAELGIDGWLINIESDLSQTHLTAEIIEQWLTYFTNKLHDNIPASKVFWYDSKTHELKLKWQDCLNDQNSRFFQATDGIFTNYTWKEDYPFMSASLADKIKPHGRYHVFTGIDIWGRNTYGGGQFDSWKALEKIKKADTSCALFAPAWTLENFSPETFLHNDDKLWYSSPSLSTFLTPRTLSVDYFYTNFNTGVGTHFSILSKTFTTKWFQLGCQSILPFLSSYSEPTETMLSVSISTSESFLGSSSLLVTASSGLSQRVTYPLYFLHFTKPQKFLEIVHKSDFRGLFGIYLKNVTGEVQYYSCRFANGWVTTKCHLNDIQGDFEVGVFVDAINTMNDIQILFGSILVHPDPQPLVIKDDIFEARKTITSENDIWIVKWPNVGSYSLIVVEDKVVAVTLRDSFASSIPLQQDLVHIYAIDEIGNVHTF